jgi:glycosyltransferase involved in cell wall biosynthesis/nucleotide-binding universal stress UspA family protein
MTDNDTAVVSIGQPAPAPTNSGDAERYVVLLPVLDLDESVRLMPLAASIAAYHSGEVLVLGVVEVEAEQSLADGVVRAREYRAEIYRVFDAAPDVAVPVSYAVRVERTIDSAVRGAITEGVAHLVLLGWQESQSSPERLFGPPIDTLLREPPCDTVVVKLGNLHDCRRILLPVRGGPHTRLASELALALANSTDASITVLYANDPRQADNLQARASLEDLRDMPRVQRWVERAIPVQQAIIAESQQHQAVVLGVAGRVSDPEAPVGPVAEHALRQFDKTAILVRHKLQQTEEQAQLLWQQRRDLSSTVDAWFAENTFTAAEFEDLRRLLALKQQQNLTISLVLPARNEEQTVGEIIASMKQALVEDVPLIDEMILMDSNSVDRTAEIAHSYGVPVYNHPDVLAQYGTFSGKGEALWKSLFVAKGDIIVWIDTDIKNIHPRFVFGILGPLLRDPKLMYCKGFYRRPMLDQDQLKATGGGRVTELMARPLLNLFYPELSGFVQPLAGEYAGRRSALEKVPFFTGYGVEIGLLIDLLDNHGLKSLSQADLTQRVHRNQELPSLSKMAFAILQVVLGRLEQRNNLHIVDAVNQSLKLIHYAQNEGFSLEVQEIRDHERPPMITIPEYRVRR